MLRKAIDEGKLQVRQRQFKAGTCLFKIGQPADTFYLVLQGSVLLSAPYLCQDTLVPHGHLLGLQDLMQEEYSQTATLAEDATLLEIPRQELLQAIQTIAPLRLYLIKLMSRQQNLATLAYE